MKKKTKKEVKPKELSLILNTNVQSVFADGVQFTIEKEICTMVFHHRIGGNALEQARVSITTDLFKRCIDVMCRLVNYYPEKPKDLIDKK